MAGKLCDGNDASLLEVRNSRAFNEGAEHRIQGASATYPITDNPYDGTGTEEETAWDAGWNLVDAYSPGIMPAGVSCVAVYGTVTA